MNKIHHVESIDEHKAACGVVFPIEETTDWNKTTCPTCLKQRNTQKTNELIQIANMHIHAMWGAAGPMVQISLMRTAYVQLNPLEVTKVVEILNEWLGTKEEIESEKIQMLQYLLTALALLSFVLVIVCVGLIYGWADASL